MVVDECSCSYIAIGLLGDITKSIAVDGEEIMLRIAVENTTGENTVDFDYSNASVSWSYAML